MTDLELSGRILPALPSVPDGPDDLLRRLTAKALARAQDVGARVDVVALAAVRATRERW